VLIARNGPSLDEVAARAHEQHGVQTRTVVQDLTDPDVGVKIADATDGLDVGLLIYNAGASERTTPFLDNEIEYSLKQIALDCTGPIALAHYFGEAMVERGRGGIVLVASLACLAGSVSRVAWNLGDDPR
jgi:short-subunit dehydrogenase